MAERCYVSDKKKEKWKIQSNPFVLPLSFVFLLLISSLQPVSTLSWDGIIVTQSDFQALQALKHELIDPRGFLRSWNDSGIGACSGSWAGIKCARGQVIVIQLPWKQLGGRLTEKIGQFQALRKLSLHNNFIGGQIPYSLGFLPNLRGIQLFNNRFSGSIPSSIGSCPRLQTLDFSNNLLIGSIPVNLMNSTRLYRLNLSFNSLSGSIPFGLTQSPSLVFIALQFNNLSGSVPDSWGQNGIGSNESNPIFKLQSLTLDHNSLSGKIPVSFTNLREIQEISLGHNRFTGLIPSRIGELSMLRSLDFSHNSINGSIPVSLSNLSSLVVLKLEQNRLSGEIPVSLGELQNLSSFNVSYNNLSGQVPVSLSRRFNSSSFAGNLQLCGYSSSTPCSISPSQSTPSPPRRMPVKQGRKLSTKDILLILGGILLIILLIFCCVLICFLIAKRGSSKTKEKAARKAGGGKGVSPPRAAATETESGSGETGGKLVHFDGPMAFTADDLLCATAEIMGKSTYGTVYKATLDDGNQVAVKRLREKITKPQREFEGEVNILGKIRHQNLLAMRAYYLGPKGEKLLVFDYMPKGSLSTFLHARGPDTPIDWPTRMKIAQGTTRGLMYLHTQENIVHGNLTSSNVLLDDQDNPKIADYGLPRLMTSAANSNVIATAGTMAYRAPELSKLKKANNKTDVYSLGVIILELLTGKSPGESLNGLDLPQWVASIVKEEWTNEVFDLELMKEGTAIGDELLNTLKLALHCVDPTQSARPEIQQVMQQLEEIRPENVAGASDDGGAAAVATTID